MNVCNCVGCRESKKRLFIGAASPRCRACLPGTKRHHGYPSRQSCASQRYVTAHPASLRLSSSVPPEILPELELKSLGNQWHNPCSPAKLENCAAVGRLTAVQTKPWKLVDLFKKGSTLIEMCFKTSGKTGKMGI